MVMGAGMIVAVVFVAAFAGALCAQFFYKWYENRLMRNRMARLDAKYGLPEDEKARLRSIVSH